MTQRVVTTYTCDVCKASSDSAPAEGWMEYKSLGYDNYRMHLCVGCYVAAQAFFRKRNPTEEA